MNPRKGISLMEKYGKKSRLRVSLKSDSLVTSTARGVPVGSYVRNAQRSKTVYSIHNKSVDMDSFETFTSLYQVTDRSCQTSMELIAGLAAASSGRRNTKKLLDDPVSFSDDHDLLSIQPKPRKKSIFEIRTSSSNCLNKIDALSSFALYPLIAAQATSPSIIEKDENSLKNDSDQTSIKSKFASFKLSGLEKRSISGSANDSGSTQYVMANSAIEEEKGENESGGGTNGSFEDAANRSAISASGSNSSHVPEPLAFKKRGSSFFGKSLKKLNKHTNLKLSTIKDKIDQKITNSIISDESVSLEVLNEMKLRDKLLSNETNIYTGKNTLDASPIAGKRRHLRNLSRQGSSLRRALEPPDTADFSFSTNNSSNSSTAYLSAATNQDLSPRHAQKPVFRVTEQLNDSSADLPLNEASSGDPTHFDTSNNESDSIDLRMIKESLENVAESNTETDASNKPLSSNLDRQVDESLEDFKKVFASSQNNLVINWDYVHSTSGYL